MASRTDTTNDLAQAVCRVILSSFNFNQEALHFASSTLGLDSSREVRSVLANLPGSPDSEQACLLDLLLSPSMAQRMELEPFLQRPGLSSVSHADLTRILMHQCPKALITFPDGQQIHLKLNQGLMESVVSRLHIQRNLPPELEKSVVDYVPHSWQAWVRVHLRLAAAPLTGTRAEFLDAVLRHIPASSPLFQEYFGFALAFVQECSDNEDMALALTVKKELLEYSLDRAAFLEKRRAGQAMETLLMQKIPMLSINTERAEKEIEIINDLSLALYGTLPGGF
ncbi:MAG: hypothetical protein ACLFT8_00875 [Desulfovermiculus sp.]